MGGIHFDDVAGHQRVEEHPKGVEVLPSVSSASARPSSATIGPTELQAEKEGVAISHAEPVRAGSGCRKSRARPGQMPQLWGAGQGERKR
jgi:hypothetical protein